MIRRVCALLLAMLALLGAARADGPLCVVDAGIAFLAEENGETLIEGDGIEDVFAVRPGALYAAGAKGSYQLYNAQGDLLGEATFAMIDDAGDCLIYRAGKLYGAMDDAGRVLLDAKWTQLVSDGAGGWLALDADPWDESPDTILRVDANGEATPTGVETTAGLSKLHDDRMPYSAPNGRWGAIDACGEVVVEATWRAMGANEGGLAKVAGPRGMGMIDADGEVVIEPDCAWLERGEGFIAALREGGVDVYTADGATLLYSVAGEGLTADVAGGCLVVTNGEQTRLYDSTGAMLGVYGTGTTFAPGVDGQLIASDGAWGEACVWLVDPDGSAASGRFQNLLPLVAGRYAWLSLPGTEYYSPALDRIQTSWNYDAARWGLLDGAGNALLPATYTEIRALSDDRLLLVSETEIALADLDGNVIRAWVTAAGE